MAILSAPMACNLRSAAFDERVEAIIEQAGAAAENSIGYTCIRAPHEFK